MRLIAFLLLAGRLSAAIVLNNTPTGTATGGAVSTLAQAFTMNIGMNDVAACFTSQVFGGGSTTGVTGVSMNGRAWRKHLALAQAGAAFAQDLELWWDTPTTTGVQAFTVTFEGSAASAVTAFQLANVNQITPFGAYGTRGGSTETSYETDFVSVIPGSMLILGGGLFGPRTVTLDAQLTLMKDTAAGGLIQNFCARMTPASTGYKSVTNTVNSAAAVWGQIFVEVIPASGGSRNIYLKRALSPKLGAWLPLFLFFTPSEAWSHGQSQVIDSARVYNAIKERQTRIAKTTPTPTPTPDRRSPTATPTLTPRP